MVLAEPAQETAARGPQGQGPASQEGVGGDRPLSSQTGTIALTSSPGISGLMKKNVPLLGLRML